jgi:hypothetical protein
VSVSALGRFVHRCISYSLLLRSAARSSIATNLAAEGSNPLVGQRAAWGHGRCALAHGRRATLSHQGFTLRDIVAALAVMVTRDHQVGVPRKYPHPRAGNRQVPLLRQSLPDC